MEQILDKGLKVTGIRSLEETVRDVISLWVRDRTNVRDQTVRALSNTLGEYPDKYERTCTLLAEASYRQQGTTWYLAQA